MKKIGILLFIAAFFFGGCVTGDVTLEDLSLDAVDSRFSETSDGNNIIEGESDANYLAVDNNNEEVLALVSGGDTSEELPVGLVADDEVYREFQAREVVDIKKGSVSVWLKFGSSDYRRDHSIFHTNDSRIALYVDTFYSEYKSQEMTRIVARAVGNQRYVDSSFADGNYPEASIIIDNIGDISDYGSTIDWYSTASFPEEEWHLVTMTWDGVPSGVVKIYLDGSLIGEKPYNTNYDDGRELFSTYAIGYRPASWTGALMGGYEIVPDTEMKLEDGEIEIRDLTIYKEVLSERQIEAIFNQSLK